MNRSTLLECTLRIHLAKTIAGELSRRQWSQTDLARETGLALAEVNRFVLGQRLPRLEKFRRLCDALAVSADELLGRNGNSADGPRP